MNCGYLQPFLQVVVAGRSPVSQCLPVTPNVTAALCPASARAWNKSTACRSSDASLMYTGALSFAAVVITLSIFVREAGLPAGRPGELDRMAPAVYQYTHTLLGT